MPQGWWGNRKSGRRRFLQQLGALAVAPALPAPAAALEGEYIPAGAYTYRTYGTAFGLNEAQLAAMSQALARSLRETLEMTAANVLNRSFSDYTITHQPEEGQQ